MASPSAYYLQLLDSRGELIQTFPPASLTSIVNLASEQVSEFDKYSTVYRVLRLTNGLYARPFTPLLSVSKRKQLRPYIVHIVSAELYHSLGRSK